MEKKKKKHVYKNKDYQAGSLKKMAIWSLIKMWDICNTCTAKWIYKSLW